MLFKIKHLTTYKYSGEVFLEPHTIRLYPKNNCYQKVHSFEISFDPKEDGKSLYLDIGENNTIAAWFSSTHSHLKIETISLVETLKADPFDYIILDNFFSSYPVEYTNPHKYLLEPYISLKHSNLVLSLSKKILEKSEHNILGFLSELSDYVYSNFQQIIRIDGDPWDSDTTINKEMGSCRDLTVLFIDLCRSVGLASRFVSGYAYGSEENIEDQLHAWAEVYIPGGGWRGYDPSLGLAASDQHIALVSGVDHNLVSPVEGTFRGNDVKTELEYSIQISKSE
ncbi:MAG: transglutaminase family protein [Thermodesulfobacteriota bacterium]